MSFLQNFKTAFDCNSIPGDPATWLFQPRMKYAAQAVLAYRVYATKEDDRQQKRMLTAYCQVIIYLLYDCATDDVMAEIEAEITSF